jgi:serine/threonine protein kinase
MKGRGGSRAACPLSSAYNLPGHAMTLSSGTQFGPYEIQSAIGAGGMGEVYKARDARLDRSVAIEVLPASVVFPGMLSGGLSGRRGS